MFRKGPFVSQAQNGCAKRLRPTPKKQHEGGDPDGFTLLVRSRSKHLALGDIHCAGVKNSSRGIGLILTPIADAGVRPTIYADASECENYVALGFSLPGERARLDPCFPPPEKSVGMSADAAGKVPAPRRLSPRLRGAGMM
jgi:hypothetical protein